jgi:hypothetical protein
MLANLLKVDANKLKATAFLNPNDRRLRRLDDGTWALEEWYKQPPPVNEEEAVDSVVDKDEDGSKATSDITTKSGISWLFLAILLILFFLITISGVILFWLFI